MPGASHWLGNRWRGLRGGVGGSCFLGRPLAPVNPLNPLNPSTLANLSAPAHPPPPTTAAQRPAARNSLTLCVRACVRSCMCRSSQIEYIKDEQRHLKREMLRAQEVHSRNE